LSSPAGLQRRKQTWLASVRRELACSNARAGWTMFLKRFCNNSTQWIVTRARVFSRRKFGIRETPHNKIRIRKRRLVLGFCDFGRTKPNSLIFSIGAGLVRAKFNVVGLANDVAIGSLLPSKSARAEFWLLRWRTCRRPIDWLLRGRPKTKPNVRRDVEEIQYRMDSKNPEPCCRGHSAPVQKGARRQQPVGRVDL
jgi:hypothetical protein